MRALRAPWGAMALLIAVLLIGAPPAVAADDLEAQVAREEALAAEREATIEAARESLAATFSELAGESLATTFGNRVRLG